MDATERWLADDTSPRHRHSETRKRFGRRNVWPWYLHSRQLRAAAFDHARDAESGRAVSSEGRVDLHPGAAARRSRQIVSGRIIFHRRESSVWRDLHLLPERRIENEEDASTGS